MRGRLLNEAAAIPGAEANGKEGVMEGRREAVGRGTGFRSGWGKLLDFVLSYFSPNVSYMSFTHWPGGSLLSYYHESRALKNVKDTCCVSLSLLVYISIHSALQTGHVRL